MNNSYDTKLHPSRLRMTVPIQKQNIVYAAIQFQCHQWRSSFQNIRLRDKNITDNTLRTDSTIATSDGNNSTHTVQHISSKKKSLKRKHLRPKKIKTMSLRGI